MKNEETNKKKILIVTAFPTHGAGSGALITTQAKSYVENGDEVVIITGNNRTDFDKLEGVKYHIVPFTAESENAEKIEGQCPFNYLMFTTHTESTANFWNVGLEEIEKYNKMFEEAIKEEVEKAVADLTKVLAGLEINSNNPAIDNDMNKPIETMKVGDTTVSIKTGDTVSMIYPLLGLVIAFLGFYGSKKRKDTYN